MQKNLEIHRRAKIALDFLSPRQANRVKKTFDWIMEHADNLSTFPGKVLQFMAKELPNTYMIEATPTLRVIFQKINGKHIIIQDVVHRDLFTLFKKV
jgi:hypothetical protein